MRAQLDLSWLFILQWRLYAFYYLLWLLQLPDMYLWGLLMICFWVQLILFGQLGHLGVNAGLLLETYIVGALFSVMGIWRHRENIKRLIAGEENKFSMNKSSAAEKKNGGK